MKFSLPLPSLNLTYRLLRWTLGLLLLALLLLALAVQTEPLVPRPTQASADSALAREFLKRNDPRGAGRASSSLRAVGVSASELALLLGYLSQLEPRLAARLQPHEGHAEAALSIALGGPFWLNLQARLEQTGGLPELRQLVLGRLPLPDWLSACLREQLLTRLEQSREAQLVRQMIRQVALHENQVVMVYDWQPSRLLETLLPPAEQQRLRVYAEHFASLEPKGAGAGARVSLAELLPPMFALAQARSNASGDPQDAAAENRALLLVLAAHASGRGLGAVLPAARQWPRPALVFLLHERDDFPLHWLVSAALSAHAGGPLADAIGIYKEVADSKDGSGFSFNDIAADRAGSRLGQLAVHAARQLQQRLAGGVTEGQLLPDVSDLPEFLSAAEFERRYGKVGSPVYQQVMRDIEARLDAEPLLTAPR